MKRMTWVPVLIGALLLVIALPIFADSFLDVSDQTPLQNKIQTASWNTGAVEASASGDETFGFGPSCSYEMGASGL